MEGGVYMGFKNDFIWSAATSAYQFEGSASEFGKGPSIQDKKEHEGDIEVAMDHYKYYKSDIKLLSEMGLSGYRFSISWSRILPHGVGEVNQEGLRFYRNLIAECEKHKIIPIITMYHDDLPYELLLKGGWSSRDTVDAFYEYAKILFTTFKDSEILWQPINEQNLLVIEKIVEEEMSMKEIYHQNHNMFIAQARTVKLFRDMNCKGRIGPSPNLVAVYPKTSHPKDVMAAQYMDVLRNLMYLDVSMNGEYSKVSLRLLEKINARPTISKEDQKILKQGKCDYISFSNYTSICVTSHDGDDYQDKTGMKYGFNIPGLFKIVENDQLGYTKFHKEVDPLGVQVLLLDIYQRYEKPIFVLERGLGLKEDLDENSVINDDDRIEYLKLQIEVLNKSLSQGIDLIGYCTWSAFDVISTSNGLDKRYGLIYINRDNENIKDLKRVPKKSYYWYKKVIESNGTDLG